MKNKSLLSEVRRMQKIAGLLRENEESMPDGVVLRFMSDVGDIEETNGTVEDVAKKVANYYKSSGYKDTKVSKPAQDLVAVSAGGNIIYIMGASAPNADQIYSLHKAGNTDSAFDAIEDLAAPSTVEGWVDHLYGQASAEQKAKLIRIYKQQMENEGATDAKEFFAGLMDSGDPEAIIDLNDLDQYDY